MWNFSQILVIYIFFHLDKSPTRWLGREKQHLSVCFSIWWFQIKNQPLFDWNWTWIYEREYQVQRTRICEHFILFHLLTSIQTDHFYRCHLIVPLVKFLSCFSKFTKYSKCNVIRIWNVCSISSNTSFSKWMSIWIQVLTTMEGKSVCSSQQQPCSCCMISWRKTNKFQTFWCIFFFWNIYDGSTNFIAVNIRSQREWMYLFLVHYS